MKGGMDITINKNWESAKPFFTVVTPVFNRHDILPRALESIKKQSFRDFEYIIVNDGSTENLDDIVIPFMDEADIPVMYIKKPNGGVHTARNAGIEEARGFLITWLDSDDEFIPDTLCVFKTIWENIPSDSVGEYYQISSRCKEYCGKEGVPFPAGINELSLAKSYKVYHKRKSENLVANRTSVMKENKWPEPEGITFVPENNIWLKLEKKYRTWFTNEILRIYHTEGTDHIFNSKKKKDVQYVRNSLWGFASQLNDWDLIEKPSVFFDDVFKYAVFRKVLKHFEPLPSDGRYDLNKSIVKVLVVLLGLPAWLAAFIYIKKKM